MACDNKLKIKIAAYEKGIIPTKTSQLQNDAKFVDEEWVKKYVQAGSGKLKIDCGEIKA